MTDPTRPHLRNALDSFDMSGGVPYLLDHLRLHAVQQPDEHGLAGPPDDDEDRRRDDEADDGVGERVAEPHPDCPEQHSEARPSVRPGVVAVGYKSRAPDLSAHPDAEDGDRLVSQEAHYRGHRDGPQQLYGLRVDEPVYRLITGNHSAKQDDKHNDHTGQILHATVTEGEAAACPKAGEGEGDPERYCCGRIAEVVDSVREQRDAAGEEDHDYLQERRDHQCCEGPLHRPDAALRGGYRGVYRSVGVLVCFVVMFESVGASGHIVDVTRRGL